jgi:hypothetical protein
METNQKTYTSQANFHLAGVVPIAGGHTGLETPFPDVLLPVANDYTLIESAIVECAYAGCDTIWIVCNDDTAPLIRYRIGDWIEDPSYYFFNTTKNKHNRKRIPIFWVPIHPKDRDKRDCLSWSVIYGALNAFKVSANISKWVIPDKYYVSFPYGLVDYMEVFKQRSWYRTATNYYMVSKGQTVQDNLYTSFTYGKDEFIKYRRNVRKGTGKYTSNVLVDGKFAKEMLPIEERWSARFFELKDVFTDLDLDEANLLHVENYYNISSWEEYRDYMSSNFAREIIKPPKEMFSYNEFNRVATN